MWKAQLSIFLLVLAVLFAKSLAQWTTVFYDDFSGPSLNATLWNVASNKTHGSQELELYLKDDVYLENGALVLRTQARQAYFGPKLYNFTSGERAIPDLCLVVFKRLPYMLL